MHPYFNCLHAILLPLSVLGVLGTIVTPALAADINLIGIFGSKATLMVDGGRPRTLAVGESSPERIRLLSVGADSAVVEIEGKRQSLHMGNQRISTARADGATARATLSGDARGHFMTTAIVNGMSMQFMVDTGATSVTISAEDARRANVRYTAADREVMQTANGRISVYRVKFDTVRVGDIVLNNVDGVVVEGNTLGQFGLLGMSFLSRTEIRRDGDIMTLTRRY
jgi:aspartyl protease family protein